MLEGGRRKNCGFGQKTPSKKNPNNIFRKDTVRINLKLQRCKDYELVNCSIG